MGATVCTAAVSSRCTVGRCVTVDGDASQTQLELPDSGRKVNVVDVDSISQEIFTVVEDDSPVIGKVQSVPLSLPVDSIEDMVTPVYGNSAFDILREALHLVQVAISPVGPWVPAIPRAYHTSVVIDGMEYSFGTEGVAMSRVMASHDSYDSLQGPAEVRNLGLTSLTGGKMLATLKPFFKRGSYDAIRKNCNAFTDCALAFLLGARLSQDFQVVEHVASHLNDRSGIVQLLGPRVYEPNKAASSFELEKVVNGLFVARGEALLSSVGSVPWTELNDVNIQELITERANEVSRGVLSRRHSFAARRNRRSRDCR